MADEHDRYQSDQRLSAQAGRGEGEIRLAVLADTHLRSGSSARDLPARVVDRLVGADAILHAGDVVEAGVLERLAGFAPLYAVLGNNDTALASELPVRREVEIGGVCIGMIHDSGRTAGRAARLHRMFPRADIVVFGHSHIPVDEEGENGQILFNPGSPTQRRAQPRPTFGELLITPGGIRRRIIPLDIPRRR